MKLKLDMLGIIVKDFTAMKSFYRDVLGLEVVMEMENYVEFKHPGIRVAISTAEVMANATKHPSFSEQKQGQVLELAFLVDEASEVDSSYDKLIKQGAAPITPPADMPWGQRAAFFADPEGNIHEVFANLPQ